MEEFLRKRLLDELADCRLTAFSDDPEEQPRLDPCADENEYASRVVEVGIHLALRRRLAERRAAIEAALERLDAGACGVCENCGEPIGRARLMANPATRLCVDCQAEIERRLPRCA